MLVDHLPAGVAHFGKRLTSYTYSPNTPQTHLQFEDGSSATCDLLVGCDGIKSVVRKQLLENHVHKRGGDPRLLTHIEPIWSGTIAYRGLIPVERLRNADGTEHRTIQSPMMVRASLGDGEYADNDAGIRVLLQYCGKSKASATCAYRIVMLVGLTERVVAARRQLLHLRGVDCECCRDGVRTRSLRH